MLRQPTKKQTVMSSGFAVHFWPDLTSSTSPFLSTCLIRASLSFREGSFMPFDLLQINAHEVTMHSRLCRCHPTHSVIHRFLSSSFNAQTHPPRCRGSKSQRHKVDGATRLEDHFHLHHVAHFVVHCATCIKGRIVNAVRKYDFDTISCTLVQALRSVSAETL